MNEWIHTFPKGISTKGNTNGLIQDFELGLLIQFLMMITVR